MTPGSVPGYAAGDERGTAVWVSWTTSRTRPEISARRPATPSRWPRTRPAIWSDCGQGQAGHRRRRRRGHGGRVARVQRSEGQATGGGDAPADQVAAAAGAGVRQVPLELQAPARRPAIRPSRRWSRSAIPRPARWVNYLRRRPGRSRRHRRPARWNGLLHHPVDETATDAAGDLGWVPRTSSATRMLLHRGRACRCCRSRRSCRCRPTTESAGVAKDEALADLQAKAEDLRSDEPLTVGRYSPKVTTPVAPAAGVSSPARTCLSRTRSFDRLRTRFTTGSGSDLDVSPPP